MNKSRLIRRSLVLAAVAGLGLLATDARAQFQVDMSRANDANTRVGSAGYNDRTSINTNDLTGRFVRTDRANDVNVVTGNQVITGNVTGFRHFRGNVPYTDPRDFRGRVGSASFDRFIGDSAGAPAPYQGAMLPGQSQPFYGAARAAPPPLGFAPAGFTGTYTPAPAPAVGITSQLNTGLLESRVLSGQSTADLLMMPGPVDPRTQLPSSMMTASPMLGVRQWDMSSTTDRAFLSNYGGFSAFGPGQMTLSPNQILQMQVDVARAAGRLPGQQQPEQPGDPNNLVAPLPQPFETPQNQNLTAPTQSNPLMQQPIGAEGGPQASMSSRLAVPPAQQSTQYAELQRRLDRYYTGRLETDETRNRELIQQLKAREAQRQTPQTPLPPTAPPQADPDYRSISQQLLDQKLGGGARPEPVQIGSLAAGVKAEQLKGVLNNAESLMKEGKYVSALEQFNTAGQVVPNNPLVMVGQAHAELAAGYFKRADDHLRRAYETDPVLTMAQFDLKQSIGRERLTLLISDLKEAARKQETDPSPTFLLAYLAYNTGAPEQAGMYLDLAQKRAGGNDKLYRLLKMNWAVPQTGAPATQPAGNRVP